MMTKAQLLARILRAKEGQWLELDLSSQGITELPPEIGQLQALQELSLWTTQLNHLPPEIGQLQTLESLNLGGNSLNRLPSEIGQLQSLQWLDLSINQLTHLPSEIGQLHALQMLNIRDNQLNHLPPEIGQLQTLESLDLGENSLNRLPPEIGQLQALQELYLHANQLNYLPPEIGQLHSLQTLDLWSNQLTQLPPEINKLQSLRILDLRYNPFNVSINLFNSLKNLWVLDLRNTPSPLPAAIARLKKQGGGIYIPQYSPDLPEEFLGQSSRHIHHYLAYEADELLPLNEAKLLLLGEGAVGKTSLVHYLLHNKFTPTTKTEGIDRQHWPNLTVNQHKIRLNIWDFGGQEILHATHQFFLTKRSVYILVLDARRGEQESRLEYWLKLIQSFGGDSPIIVAINKTDEEHRLTLNQRFLQDKYPNIIGFYPTSCCTGAGIPALKTAITDTVATLPHIHDLMPAPWFALKQSLESHTDNYISYERYQTLCQEHQITSPGSQDTLCGFLHDLGIVLNFRDDERFDRLRETNVLNPEWVTNAVYKLLNNLDIFKNHGVFSKANLATMLDNHGYPSPKEHQFIIDMLQKFEMCFPLPDEPHTYLIPQLLQNDEPDLNWDKPASLRFQYHYDILPHSVFSRFIVRLHENISQKTYWRTGVVLQHDGNKALVTADIEDRKIFVWVNGDTATRRVLLGIIRKEFAHIHSTIRGLVAKEKVPYQDITVDYQHLRTLEKKQMKTFIPEGLDEAVSVKALLADVDIRKAQVAAQTTIIVHGDYISGDQPMRNINQTITNSTLHGSAAAAETVSHSLNTETAPSPAITLNNPKSIVKKKIFLASSMELKTDREQFEIAISRRNKALIDKGLFLELVHWEDFIDAMSHTRLQNEYNQAVQGCDIFVMLFWRKVGKYTAEEFTTAFGQFAATKKPLVYTYFKDADVSMAELDEDDTLSLFAFKKALKNLGHFPTLYKTTEDLHYKFIQQLEKIL